MILMHQSTNTQTYWSLYNDKGEYQRDISGYLLHCVDDLELNRMTVRGRAYALKSWANFVFLKDGNITSANNALIKQYREHLVDHKNKNSSGDLNSRKRSVNQYLRIVYDFYNWLQSRTISAFILGLSDAFNISSTLNETSKRHTEHENYPLLFRHTSSRSKHRTTYTPDYNTFLALYRYFISAHSSEVAERDCLILRIAFEAGLRVASTASLKITDFDPTLIDTSGDSFKVQPGVQKFGMANSFEISINLAISIKEYIEGSRQKIIQKVGSTSNNLFLDTIKGSNLLPTSISSNFSKASKKLGLPYRSGIHCWRGLFTENLIDFEIDARTELGFDTSVESIGLVVSKALGHSNPMSQQSYIRSLRNRQRSSQAFKHLQEVSMLRQELLHTSKTCELLRKEIVELTKGNN